MLDLRRYDLPLVQLLIGEFAANPANRGEPGSMRIFFLRAYAETCHTKFADVAEGVNILPALAHVLRAYKPARELLQERLRAAKLFTAQSFSGTHRLGRVDVREDETLMQMRTRIFQTQRRDGRTPKDLVGSGDFIPGLRVSKVKGRFTLEWRHRAHIHRHFSCKGAVLSYDNARESAMYASTDRIGNLASRCQWAALTSPGSLGARAARVRSCTWRA
jgi:hypothetical protein